MPEGSMLWLSLACVPEAVVLFSAQHSVCLVSLEPL